MKVNKFFISSACALFAAIFFFSSCKNANNKYSAFELNGVLSQAGEGIKIYLDRLLPDTVQHLDSTTIDKQGKFSFHTTGIYKGFYTVRINDQDYATLILDSTEKVQLRGNAQNLGYTYMVNGSPDSKLFWDFNVQSKNFMIKQDSMQRAFQTLVNAAGGNQKKIDSLNDSFEAPYDTMVEKQQSYLKKFIHSNLNSFSSLAAIQEISPDKDIAYYISLDSALIKNYPKSAYVQLFHSKTETMRKLAFGSIAPEINLPDTSGKMVPLSSLRGKVVLIDFWASWCEPCKQSLPGLIKIYNKYKDKNFAIYGVSLDKFKQNWVGAIYQFKIPWTQVSELKYWNSSVVKLYDFSGIPFTVLISPDGVIMDKKLNDSQLESTLHTLLDKPGK